MSTVQRGVRAARRLVREGMARPVKAAHALLTRSPASTRAAVPRIVPELMAPVAPCFPAARYVIIVESIPRRYAGRTSSILAKTRLLAEAADVHTEVVVTGYSAELPLISSESAARGQRDPRVTLHNLYDWLTDDTDASPVAAEPPVEDPAFVAVANEEEGTVSYVLNGIVRASHTFDEQGRLLVRQLFDENGVLTLREDFDGLGHLRHRCVHSPGDRQPADEYHYRRDGSLYSHRARREDPAHPRRFEDRTEVFDHSGSVTATYPTYGEFVQAILTSRFGDDRTFLTVEARMVDEWLIGWGEPNVKQIYVLHNTHLKAPYTDVHAVTASFRRILGAPAAVGATVFLTGRQRADAERHYGPAPNWVVIPHAARPVADHEEVARDPNLVVMFTRLEPQKQLEHAVRVFQKVVQEVPEARLEIYGHGPDHDGLQRLIDQLGVTDSVRLCGYTREPDRILQRAALSLLTSRYEGLPLVLAECMANGCPLVSYDVTYGPSDMIQSGVNGILIEPGNILAMAAAVVRLLQDEPLRQRMGTHGRSTIDRYTPELLVSRWANLFQTLAAEWESGPGDHGR